MNKGLIPFKIMTPIKLRSEMYSAYSNMAYTEINRTG